MTVDVGRLEAAHAEMDAAGIGGLDRWPPLFPMLGWIGITLRPPHYRPLWANMVTMAAWFGPVWGLGMWLLEWRAQEAGPGIVIAQSAAAGLLFGAVVAGGYRWSARRRGLSRWEDLPTPGPACR